MTDRLDTLRWLYDVTQASIEEAPADKRSPLIGQMRAIAEEIAELESESGGGGERNGLIDFTEALAERRQSTAKGARRTTH